MKRGLLTFLFAITTFICLNAQENEMYIKSMLGGTLSTLTNLDNTKMKLGLVAGGEFGYRFSNPFALTAGVLFSITILFFQMQRIVLISIWILKK